MKSQVAFSLIFFSALVFYFSSYNKNRP